MSLHDEGTIARLAIARGAEQAFLQAHHVAAGDRLERMIARACLTPRLTMSYDPAQAGGRRGSGNGVAEMTETAAEARKKLNKLACILPADCWNIAFDVCGLGKGLQTIEMERGWPRRSAKLVLRIALDQLAAQFGLAPFVTGGAGGATRGWMEERLPLIAGDDAEGNEDTSSPGSGPCPRNGCD